MLVPTAVAQYAFWSHGSRYAVRVALPRVCHQVSGAGTSRSSRARLAPARSTRSSSQRNRAPMLHRDLVGNPHAEVPISGVEVAVLDLRFEAVQRARRRAGEYGAGFQVEHAFVAGAAELLLGLVEAEPAAEVSAATAVDRELLAVLGIDPDAPEGAVLHPRVGHRLDEVHLGGDVEVERLDVAQLDPGLRGRPLERRGDERAHYRNAGQHGRAQRAHTGGPLEERPPP